MRITLDEPEKPVEKTEDSIERESIKKTWDGEKKKLSTMTFPQKCKYIWGYYKWSIIIGLMIITLVSYITFIYATKKNQTIMGVVVNDSQVKVNEYLNCLDSYLELGSHKKTELVDSVNLAATGNAIGVNAGNYSGSTQMMCYVMAKELDYAFTDTNGLNYLATNELLLRLDEFLPENIYEAFKDRMYELKDSTLKGPRAIDITGTKLAECLGLKSSPLYLCFQNLSGHEEEMKKFLEFLYEFEFGNSGLSF